MTIKRTFAHLCLGAFCIASPVLADQGNDSDSRCKSVNGQAVWSLIPAPNDPFGRVLGPSTGDLKAAVSANLTSFVPQPDGSFKTTSVEVWVFGPKDMLIFAGNATFTPIPGQPAGTVDDQNTLTVIGGFGAYAGATGTVQVSGTGYNLFSGPGQGYFDVKYKGNICQAR